MCRRMWEKERLFLIDPLTGGYNRDGFLKYSVRCIEENPNLVYSIVCMNICEFRQINELWGESAGNETLQFVYREMKKGLKTQELVCRSSIDCFLLLLRGSTKKEISGRIDQMIRSMNEEIRIRFGKYTLKFTVGVCPLCGQTVVQAISNAVYMEKESRVKNICVFFDAEARKRLQEEKELNERFEKSIRNREFIIYLQPKVSVHGLDSCEAEALVRWKHPLYGMICPERFISLFEKNGKICELDLYVFEEVCRLLSGWIRENRSVSKISVNLSRFHLRSAGREIWKKYSEIKKRYQIPDRMIEVELTETVLLDIEQIDFVKEILDNFRSCGFLVALDDFGFAYSSLTLLKEFEIDTLKLDRSFFVNENERSRQIVKSMIELAHNLDMKVVAEGIEDAEQVTALKDMNCDFIQGFIYSQPMAVEVFESWRDAHEKGQ